MNAADIPDISLAECLDILRRVFDIDQIAAQTIDEPTLVEYYRQSDQGYRLFHSSEGALHLAMNQNGQFDPAGYCAQPEFVAEHIAACNAQRVLEAGSGNGFNTLYLARKHPHKQFVGIDLTAQHIAAAHQAAVGLSNAKFLQGNYESLDYPASSFDLAFGVETFCQTGNIGRALAEMHRLLRPGGRLCNVDCFLQRPLATFDKDLQLAARLVEKTTAVDRFAVVGEGIELARSIGFKVLHASDDSVLVGQNLARLYRLARGFFEDPLLVDTVRQTLPPLMLQNTICGMLMPFTVGGGAHGYYSIVLERAAE